MFDSVALIEEAMSVLKSLRMALVSLFNEFTFDSHSSISLCVSWNVKIRISAHHHAHILNDLCCNRKRRLGATCMKKSCRSALSVQHIKPCTNNAKAASYHYACVTTKNSAKVNVAAYKSAFTSSLSVRSFTASYVPSTADETKSSASLIQSITPSTVPSNFSSLELRLSHFMILELRRMMRLRRRSMSRRSWFISIFTLSWQCAVTVLLQSWTVEASDWILSKSFR